MQILCTICSDLVNQAESPYVTKCGHIFHHKCLAQWLERGTKSCPQCRNKVTDECMFRMYPSVSDESSGDDAATLQARLDDAMVELRTQHTKHRELQDKLAAATQDLSNKDESLRAAEKRLVSRESAVAALREQLEYVKLQNRDTERLREREENELLKKNMQTITGLMTENLSYMERKHEALKLKRKAQGEADTRDAKQPRVAPAPAASDSRQSERSLNDALLDLKDLSLSFGSAVNRIVQSESPTLQLKQSGLALSAPQPRPRPRLPQPQHLKISSMDTDDGNSGNNLPDGGKFASLKAFVDAAREFESSHSEASLNLMNRHLNLLASTCDLSIFAPGRSEVCALFCWLLRVMRDPGGPHWAGVELLSRACNEPNARYALTHTYKYMPWLSTLLAYGPTNERKIKLLSTMQRITYGIKIRCHESYLLVLMKRLTDYIISPFEDTEEQLIEQKSLSILANVCAGNLPAVDALMKTVDITTFVLHLIFLKDGMEYATAYGADVCRLLLCLPAATCGPGALRQADVNSYFCCAMQTFKKSILEKDEVQLLQAYALMKELCSDANLRNLVAEASMDVLEDSLKNLVDFCNEPVAMDEYKKPAVVKNALNFLAVLVNLDMYPVRKSHCQILCLCLVSHRICLPESLELFSIVLLQYRDEGQLPENLILMIGQGLPELLVPPALEPGKAGFQWLQVVGALCETGSMKERVLRAVAPEFYEHILYSVLQHTSQNGLMGAEQGVQAAVLGCKTALLLAPLMPAWGSTLERLHVNKQVCKMLSAGLLNDTRRMEILELITHYSFPSEQKKKIFEDLGSLWFRERSFAPMVMRVTLITPGSENRVLPRRPPRLDRVQVLATHIVPYRQENAIDDLERKFKEALQTIVIYDTSQYALFLYLGSELLKRHFPLHVHVPAATHAQLLATHAFAMLVWLAVGVALHRKRIFITL